MTTRTAAVLGCVLALGLATGCGGGDTASGGAAPAAAAAPAAQAGPPATLKQLAERTGCKKPQVQTEADELRQGVCKTGKGQYTVTTFASDDGKAAWLEEAKKWGGNYLVGTRWVIAGNDPAVLQSFSEKVGGVLEATAP
ncbi:hypothetical protein Sme01_11750 [Sphaerisporangium melleum]|uniref:Lipoprotein n=1 Tax=Sphaerisporangium melleum TaxID=321316 RepID=A0A917RGP3_9ACTN|nr:hypothetical protein [Sphaerisporangium melleum]GGL07374.1 hypothetical protein GCM10007964_57030 [Sphaerisporangium melleum]GII68699.1 hypothetical protein Sme01_11750 [Sphaerisporangium melleum]